MPESEHRFHRTLLLAVLHAALFALAFPDPGWSLLALVAPAPLALLALAIALLLTFVRLVRGPSLMDRVTALELIASLVAGIVAVYAIGTDDPALIDVAIALALVAFMSAVAFARYADTVCPMTLAHGALPRFLETVHLAKPRTEEDGTAIGDAIALAAARLKTAEDVMAKQAPDRTDRCNRE